MSLLEAAAMMPWTFWVLMGGVVILVSCALWVSTKRPTDFNQQFYDRWMKRINADLRDVRRRYKRADRAEAYKATFTRMYADLEAETGPPENYHSLPTAQRSVWIHMLTRIRDVLYFS